jgi:hypothetical protein
VHQQVLNADSGNQIELDLQLDSGTYLMVLDAKNSRIHQRVLIME